ncbi:Beta-adaptin-like protein B [Hibiscus syriacus]|uniref:Beta-adaptin-like protein B n=1 Tax=Hibiscus syriacus TaxID=106335 RepID=A0A6A2XJ78_HIBSY|nr:Beta-adaptin-like protein B [Hibiscus syriacus]
MTVTQYFTLMSRLLQQLDLFESHEWRCVEDARLFKKIVEQCQIFQFLSGLHRDLDEVWGRVLGLKPLSSIREVFFEVRREENRRTVMLPNSQPVEGSVLLIHSQTITRPKKGRPWCDYCRIPSATLANKSATPTWIADSYASDHMTGFKLGEVIDSARLCGANVDSIIVPNTVEEALKDPKWKKARLVVKGFTQSFGVDFQETFAPVAKLNTVRVLLSLAVNENWVLHQLDIKNAFLNGNLEDEVYMLIPLDDDCMEIERLKKLLAKELETKDLGTLRYFFGMELFGDLVTWRSRKQVVVSRSSAETEFRVMALGICEGIWLQKLLTELGLCANKCFELQSDSKSAISIAKNPVHHDQTKHVEIDKHFISEKVNGGSVKLNYVSTKNQLADILTKAFPRITFDEITSKLGLFQHLLPNLRGSAAKDVVLAEKPVISDDSNQLDPSLLDELLANIATLSSVYHKPPDAFVTRTKMATHKTEDGDHPDAHETGYSDSPSHAAAAAASPPASSSSVPYAAARQLPPAPVPDLLGDLIGVDNNAIVPTDQLAAPSGPPLPILLPASTGQGLQISAQLARQDGQIFYSLLFENNTQVTLDGFMIQFNKNSFGLAAAGPLQVPPLPPGASTRALLPMVLFQNLSAGPPSSLLQVAVKNNQQLVWYFNDRILLHVFFVEDGRMERTSFLETWRLIPDSNEVQKEFPGIVVSSAKATLDRLAASNMLFIAKRKQANQDVFYFSAKIPRGIPFLIELTTAIGSPGVQCAIKTPNPEMAPMFFESIESLLKN